MRRKVSIATPAFLELLICRGIRATASVFSVSHRTVCTEIKRRGLPVRHQDRIASMSDDWLLGRIQQHNNRLVKTANSMKVSSSWLRMLLAERGLWEPPSRKGLPHLTVEEVRGVIVKAGTVAKGAKRLGVSYRMLIRYVNENGLRSRVCYDKRLLREVTDEDLEAALHDNGLGVNICTVRREIRRRAAQTVSI